MPITEVKIYRASDGESFDSYDEACQHELFHTMRTRIEAKIRENVDLKEALDWSPVEMAEWIVEHLDDLKKIEVEAYRINGGQ